MASKRRLRKRACDRKIQYDTREKAIGQMQRLIRIRGGVKITGWMEVYSCNYCGGFHFGHLRKRL